MRTISNRKLFKELLQINMLGIGSADLKNLLSDFGCDLDQMDRRNIRFSYEDMPVSYTTEEIYRFYETFDQEFELFVWLPKIKVKDITIGKVSVIITNVMGSRSLEINFYSNDAKMNGMDSITDHEFFAELEESLISLQKRYKIETIYGGLDTAVAEKTGAYYIHQL